MITGPTPLTCEHWPLCQFICWTWVVMLDHQKSHHLKAAQKADHGDK